LWNHLSAMSEGVPALGWVAVSPTPGPYAAEYKGNSEFYTNKLRVQYKGKDEVQMGFADGLSQFLGGLVAFIKKFHTTELTWNPRGGDAQSAGPAAPVKSAGGIPPPPGPPPPPIVTPVAKGADMGALFSQINSVGENAALGLKKVTADMKSKNRQDKVSVVKASEVKAPVASKARGAVKKGAPKFALEGNKWIVENQDDNHNISITDTEPKHTVYIYKCDRTVVQIKGKVNSICIDSSHKVGVIFESAIASVELVNSGSVDIQVTGKVPSFAIDKCSGVQLILSKECLNTEIVSSKSDAMNVQFPVAGQLDLVEMAIPEQFKTTIVNGKLSTASTDHV